VSRKPHPKTPEECWAENAHHLKRDVMERRSVQPLALAAAVVLLVIGVPASASLAQQADRPASNITPYDTRSVIAPALPVPPVPLTAPPSAFLSVARSAVQAGRTGEAQEALERAETWLLDRSLPAAAVAAPDSQQAVLAIGTARRALAARDRRAAIAAIDDALAAADRSGRQISAAAPLNLTVPSVPLPPPAASPPEPVITRALLPGHWALDGAQYVWIPPETTPRQVQSAELVPGTYVWRKGAYVWVPTHYGN
jgi:hypothetical protein